MLWSATFVKVYEREPEGAFCGPLKGLTVVGKKWEKLWIMFSVIIATVRVDILIKSEDD